MSSKSLLFRYMLPFALSSASSVPELTLTSIKAGGGVGVGDGVKVGIGVGDIDPVGVGVGEGVGVEGIFEKFRTSAGRVSPIR